MKNQFTPFNTPQDQENQSRQSSQSSQPPDWLTGDRPVPSAPSSEARPPQITHRPPHTGLLSGWKAAQQAQAQAQQPQTQPNTTKNFQEPSVPPYQPVQPPGLRWGQNPAGTAQGFNAGTVPQHPQQHPFPQAFVAGPAAPPSPHQSGIGPSPFQSQPQQGQRSGPSQQQHHSTFGPSSAQQWGGSQNQNGQLFGPPPAQPLMNNPQPMVVPTSNAWQQQGPLPFVQPPGSMNGGKGPNKHKNTKTRKKRRFPIWARVVVAMLTVLIVIVGSGFIYYQMVLGSAVSSITDHSLNQNNTYTQGNGKNNQPQKQVTLGPAYSGGRLNILLMGSDDDQKTILRDGMLAQTDIIISVDPSTKKISMFTIPRDTVVYTPTGRLIKLDQVFLEGGGANQNKDNAASFVAATLQYDFGIHIDHFAWVGLTGFAKVIHTLGGVDVNVTHPIVDGEYPDDTLNPYGKVDIYAVKRLYITPGPQHLNDLTALEYVRSRHADLVGDIGRATRQQQVLNDIKIKAENLDIISKIPELVNDLKGYLQTSVPISDMASLANLARQINSNSINRVVLDGQYSRTVNNFQTDRETGDVVLLNCAAVRPLIDKTFNLNGNAKCNTGVDFGSGQRLVDGSSSQPVASIPPSPGPNSSNSPAGTVSALNTANVASSAQMPQSSTTPQLNIGGGPDMNNWFGIRSLLDMLLCITFESFDALTV